MGSGQLENLFVFPGAEVLEEVVYRVQLDPVSDDLVMTVGPGTLSRVSHPADHFAPAHFLVFLTFIFTRWAIKV